MLSVREEIFLWDREVLREWDREFLRQTGKHVPRGHTEPKQSIVTGAFAHFISPGIRRDMGFMDPPSEAFARFGTEQQARMAFEQQARTAVDQQRAMYEQRFGMHRQRYGGGLVSGGLFGLGLFQ